MSETAQRALGAYALTVAAIVGVNFVATPLYDDGSTGYPVWRVIDWFMSPASLIGAGASLAWWLRDRDADDPARRLGAGAYLSASAVLALWFHWNWFGDLMGRAELLLWSFIDPLFAVVVAAAALRLLRGR